MTFCNVLNHSMNVLLEVVHSSVAISRMETVQYLPFVSNYCIYIEKKIGQWFTVFGVKLQKEVKSI